MTNKEQTDRIIRDEILTLANEMMNALAECDPCVWSEFTNAYDEETDEPKEIFQYFIVTDWLANKLIEIDEPVAFIHGLAFWGRTCCGQAIELDGTIQKVVEGLNA